MSQRSSRGSRLAEMSSKDVPKQGSGQAQILAKRSARNSSARGASGATSNKQRPSEEQKMGMTADFLPDIGAALSESQALLRPASGRNRSRRGSRAGESARDSKAMLSQTLGPSQLGGHLVAENIILDAEKKRTVDTRPDQQPSLSFRSKRGGSRASRMQASSGLGAGGDLININDGKGKDAYLTVKPSSRASHRAKIDFHGVQDDTLVQVEGLNEFESAKVVLPIQIGAAGQSSLAPPSSRRSRRPESGRSNKSRRKSIAVAPKINAWADFDVASFKMRHQEPSQIIDKLKKLTATDIPFMGELPKDDELVSTDPLDSFMSAFMKIVSDRSMDFTKEVRQGIHLATGTRTEFCEHLLTFLCHHQKVEQALRDSVDFFMESLNNLVHLEQENKTMKAQIAQLLDLKEGDILEKYKLQRHLDLEKRKVDEAAELEKQAQAKITQLQSMLQDKMAECDSLSYRLQHFQEIRPDPLTDPSAQLNATGSIPVATRPEGAGRGAVPNAEDAGGVRSDAQLSHGQTESLGAGGSQVNLNTSFQQRPDSTRFMNLQQENRKLEEEIENLRISLRSKDDSAHLRKIQELFNKIQIENKNLRIYNQKCETKLTSKQNVIDHLEGKNHRDMAEKKEIIINLKSEIVLLKKQIETAEEDSNDKLAKQQSKLQEEYAKQYHEQIQELECRVSEKDKERKDLKKRLMKLHEDDKELSTEFTRFRREKEDQEKSRNAQFKELEYKMQQLQSVYDEKINQLNKQIEELENQAEVIKKENNILTLRQKYLMQSTETLVKQKVFLFETLTKGRGELAFNLSRMENAMLASNNNQEYLVPVKRCIREAKEMADMGQNMLMNISQILQFLKIEKLHQLLSSDAELIALERQTREAIHEERIVGPQGEKASIMDQIASTFAPKKGAALEASATSLAQPSAGAELLQIQRYLNMIGAGGDSTPAPTGERTSKSNLAKASSSQAVTSLEHRTNAQVENSIEIACISTKILAEMLLRTGACSHAQDVPTELTQVLQLFASKSDARIETDLMQKNFSNAKQLLDGAVEALLQRRDTAESLKRGPGVGESTPAFIPNGNMTQPSVDRKGDTLVDPDNSKGSAVRSQGKVKASGGGHGGSSSSSSKSGADEGPDALSHGQGDERHKELSLEIETLQNKLDQQKIKSKNLQLNLAGKIVVLEEQIEKMNNEKEDHIKKMEQAHTEELEQAKSGVAQREQQFLQLCDEYREEIRDLQVKLEQQWKPAEESRTIKKMEQGTRGSLYKMMKEEYETLFRTNSELLKNYQTSINEFVYLREDLRGSFTLAFEIDRLEKSGLQHMLNESLLKYYLSKTFQIDKSKFRFLRSEELYEVAPAPNGEAKAVRQKSKLLRLVIEVIAEDHARVSHLFKNVKAQIKDGTSLLYDFMPLYFAMNLGSSGFSTHHNLKEFQLLSKAGQAIDGVDYVVSVLRHKQKPLIFKVIAFNLEMREEFMVELSESDIYELVEGEQQILKSLEPDRLVQKITTNLNIIVRDKLRVLTCDHKIFFSEIWMKNMESHKHQQVHLQSPLEAAWVGEDGQVTQMSKSNTAYGSQDFPLRTRRAGDTMQIATDSSLLNSQSKLTNTAARTTQLSHLQVKNPPLPQDFVQKFNTSVGTNTDFVISDLYEGFESVYRGVQNLGEVTKMRLSILESTKTKTLLFSFDDLQSLKKLKFSLYEKESSDQYVIHIECMKISDGHHVMISVEQIQEQGLLIRMYDLQDCRSVYFALLRKQNGQYTRLSDDSRLDLLMRQDFRNFIYRLSFLANAEENEQIIQSYQFLFEAEIAKAKKSSRAAQMEAEQKRQAESMKRESIVNQIAAQSRALPRRKRALSAMRFESFSLHAFRKDKFAYLRRETSESARNLASARQTSRLAAEGDDHHAMVDWRDQPDVDKGALLYRQVYYVRCHFDGGEMQCNESVISLYLRDRIILIEVVLFREPSQISIASQVPAPDLFAGEDPLSVPFKDRTTILNKMLEKFFIVSEGGLCQMKVEVDEIDIHEYRAAKAVEQQAKQKQDKQQFDYDMMSTANRDIILEQKNTMINNGEAVQYRLVADVDGESHDISVLFLRKQAPQNRQENRGPRTKQKNTSRFGKAQTEIRQQNIEDFIEQHCFWDQILFEIADEEKESIKTLFNIKKLASMLSKDEFFIFKSVLSNVEPNFLKYIQESIKVDKQKNEVYLENRQNMEKNILQKYKMYLGGRYLGRMDVDLPPAELKVMRRQLISNEEIQFCQYLYDIKVYELQMSQSRDIISYQFEIFAVSDPTEVYLYNYPLNFSANVQDPHTLVIDIFNLIESPLKKYEKRGAAVSNADRKKLNKSGNVKQEEHSRAPGGATIDSDTVSKMNKDDIKRQLFRKYIDHRLVLMIQEQRFPRRLDVMIVEPCSQLMWRNCFEPRVITSHGLPMGSMHLVDQATLEMLVAVVIDETEHHDSSKLFELDLADHQASKQSSFSEGSPTQKVEKTGKFSEIKETRSESSFVHNYIAVEDELAISLFKRKDLFNISLRKPKVARGSSLKGQDTQSDNQTVDLAQPSMIAEEATNDELLLIRVNPEIEQFAVHKVVKLTGLNYAMLMVAARDSQILVKVVLLEPEKIKTLFQFTFHEEKPFPDDDSDQMPHGSPIFTMTDIKRTVTDNLRRYYGSQAMEQGLRICDHQRQVIQAAHDTEYEELTVFEKMNEEAPSVHTMRLLQKYREQQYHRCIVFHRKSIFDDERERLLLLQIRLKITQAECRDELFTYEPPMSFSIVISEPETQQEIEFSTELTACLTPEELSGSEGDLTDLRILRRLARIVLEERVDIRRSKPKHVEAASSYDQAPASLNIYQAENQKDRTDLAAMGDEHCMSEQNDGKNMSELQYATESLLENYVVAINFNVRTSTQPSQDNADERQGSGREYQNEGADASAASTGRRTSGEAADVDSGRLSQRGGVMSRDRKDQSTIFEEAASNEEDPADPSKSRREVSGPNSQAASMIDEESLPPASAMNQRDNKNIAIQEFQIQK